MQCARARVRASRRQLLLPVNTLPRTRLSLGVGHSVVVGPLPTFLYALLDNVQSQGRRPFDTPPASMLTWVQSFLSA